MRASTVAIISTLVILLFFAGFTIYGNKVGNFVINVDLKSDVRLSLSAQEDLSKQTERLAYGALTSLTNSTYDWLPEDISRKGMGNVSDEEHGRYMAYTFYLINNSDREVDCDLDMNLIDTVGDPMGMLRVMLIEEDALTSAEGNRIYALKESSPERKEAMDAELETYYTPYNTVDFLIEEGDTSGTLFSVQLRDFAAGGSRKYTVVIWRKGATLIPSAKTSGPAPNCNLTLPAIDLKRK